MKIPEIHPIQFKNQSLAYRKAAIKSKLQELGKPAEAVEYRIEMKIAGAEKDYYTSADDALLKKAHSVSIIPLWEDYIFRFGYWCKRYYDQPEGEDATPEEFDDWIASLDEPMKSKFRRDGLEECRGVVGFMRFVNECRDMGMDEFLEKNIRAEDWDEYLSLKKNHGAIVPR